MIGRNSTKDKVWNYCINILGMNEFGAAGLMGNLQSESCGSNPTCVQASLIKHYREEMKFGFGGWGYSLYSQETFTKYTSLVDSGKISKAEFIHPRQYTGVEHQYGYGLCQWTSEGRKERLWKNTRGVGKSIGDLDGQLKTLSEELNGTYLPVLNKLRTAKSVKEASDYVLQHFEQPANWQAYSAIRASYGTQYYNLYRNKKKMAADLTADTFLVAIGETCNLARTKHFIYGDSHATPPCADNKISCDRMIAKALWDLGFTDQPVSTTTTSGITCGNMDTYLRGKGWTKYTTFDKITKGSIVLVKNNAGALHTFVTISYNNVTKVFNKYDCGSNERINAVQPFIGEKWGYKELVAVYNLPNPTAPTPTTTAWKAAGTATATTALNVRSAPFGKILMTLGKGNRFEVDGTKDGKWVHIKVNNVIGWVSGDYIKYDGKAFTPFVGEATTKVNVRTKDSVLSFKLKEYPLLNAENRVDVLAEGSWGYQVRIANKYIGWVSKKYIKRV